LFLFYFLLFLYGVNKGREKEIIIILHSYLILGPSRFVFIVYLHWTLDDLNPIYGLF